MSMKQNGDTIIEVLLAMAVIGIVLGSAFGIANRNLNTGRSAQERSVALKIAESQLELMKTLIPPASTPTEAFCISPTSPSITLVSDVGDPCNNKDGSGGVGLYTISITPPATPPPPVTNTSYKINVSWDDISGRTSGEKNKVILYYRLGAL